MDTPRENLRRNVILSFRIGNVPSIETFNGTLRYIRTYAKWNVRMYTYPKILTAETVTAAEADGIDGIITDHPIDGALAEALCTSQIPLVAIGNSDERLFQRCRNMVFLEMDNEAIGRMAAQHFSSLGRFRTFGFLPDPEPTRWSEFRLLGFRTELAKRGHLVEIFTTAFTDDGQKYRAALAHWLGGLPRPAAILLVGDYRATVLFEACAAKGLHIPNDIAVLGVDNNPILCEATSPSLSSVEPPFEAEGFEAARTLDRLMASRRGTSRPQYRSFSPVRIFVRESTRMLSPGSHLIDRALAFIQANLANPITARDVARKLGVSSSLLALRFRQYERNSVRETILTARLAAACSLLRETALPIGRIATRCGFAHANRFSHLFAERLGMSPRAYRTSNSSKVM